MEDYVLVGIIARSIERIVAVFFGGLAIYFGYRLFHLLPTQKGNSGKIELPGMSVIISKAGPGIFFVAFGSIILLSAFSENLSFKLDNPNKESHISYFSPGENINAQDVARARLAIQVHNCILKEYGSLNSSISSEDLEVSVTDAKLALLASVWNEANWGKYQVFYEQVRTGGGKGMPAYSIFSDLLPDCSLRPNLSKRDSE